MPHRVSPTERVRSYIDELFASDRPLPEILKEVARLGAQLLRQAALEAEVTEFLGRGRYQRATVCEDARAGPRNGYREVTVKTTARPELRGTTEAFASRMGDWWRSPTSTVWRGSATCWSASQRLRSHVYCGLDD